MPNRAFASRAVEPGAWDFLSKPSQPEMLGFVIGRAVRGGALRRAAVAWWLVPLMALRSTWLG
jgi:FixJ family two-component response regulator